MIVIFWSLGLIYRDNKWSNNSSQGLIRQCSSCNSEKPCGHPVVMVPEFLQFSQHFLCIIFYFFFPLSLLLSSSSSSCSCSSPYLFSYYLNKVSCGFKLSMSPMMSLNFLLSHLYLLITDIRGLCHHTQLYTVDQTWGFYCCVGFLLPRTDERGQVDCNVKCWHHTPQAVISISKNSFQLWAPHSVGLLLMCVPLFLFPLGPKFMCYRVCTLISLLAFECLPCRSLWHSSSELWVVQVTLPFCKIHIWWRVIIHDLLCPFKLQNAVWCQFRSSRCCSYHQSSFLCTTTPGDGRNWSFRGFSIACSVCISLPTPLFRYT